jgi:hypothetical protein
MVVVHGGMPLYGPPKSKLGYHSIPITAGCAEAMAATSSGSACAVIDSRLDAHDGTRRVR